MTFLENVDSNKFVYHYTSKERALEGILRTQEFRLGTYRRSNDPRESKDWGPFTGNLSNGPGSRFKMLGDLTDAARAYQDRIRVGCFTRDPPEMHEGTPVETRGFALARMWAQYGAAHSGVCLVFNREELTNAAKEAVESPSSLISKDVRYVTYDAMRRQYVDAYDFEAKEIPDGEALNEFEKHLRSHAEPLLFYKSEDWSGQCPVCS